MTQVVTLSQLHTLSRIISPLPNSPQSPKPPISITLITVLCEADKWGFQIYAYLLTYLECVSAVQDHPRSPCDFLFKFAMYKYTYLLTYFADLVMTNDHQNAQILAILQHCLMYTIYEHCDA